MDRNEAIKFIKCLAEENNISVEIKEDVSETPRNWMTGSIFDIKEDEEYYSLDYFGCVSTECYTGNNDDYDTIDFGNACKDKEYMQSMLRKIKLYNYLSNFAEVVNEGWKPDWSDCRQEKWICFYDHSICFWLTNIQRWYEEHPCDVYFKSEELAQRAIDEIIIPFERGEL